LEREKFRFRAKTPTAGDISSGRAKTTRHSFTRIFCAEIMLENQLLGSVSKLLTSENATLPLSSRFRVNLCRSIRGQAG
jgi:hypothetical protein